MVKYIQIIMGLCYLLCVVCSWSILWMIDKILKFAHKNMLQYYVYMYFWYKTDGVCWISIFAYDLGETIVL
jgi:hypothetical protein